MFLICPYVFMNLATLFLQSLFLQKMCRDNNITKILNIITEIIYISFLPMEKSDYVRNKAFSVWCLVNLL